MNDREIATMFRRLESPIEPGSEVDERVEARMYRALTDHPHTAMGDDPERRERSARPFLPLLVAACVAVLIGGVALVSRTTQNEAPAFGGSTIPAPTPPTSTDLGPESTTNASVDGLRVDVLPDNVLGYQPFTSTGFRLGNPPVAPNADAVLERVGEAVNTGDGFVTQVRRVNGPELLEMTIVIRADGSALVPIDFLDIRGDCTGGAVIVSLHPTPSQSTSAECSGNEVTIVVDVATGPIVSATVDGQPTDVQPITYTFSADSGQAPSTITLWHTPGDLVSAALTTETDSTNDTSTEESP